ncbi:MAG: GntR family transcriptional regulator [Treponema sp.]|nr:GntR family transcriptional regulator [Treponema sp.]MCR4630053.1 GntR family transcriptional regulator [Treponema sp.]
MKNITKLPKESNREFALRVIRENIINLELKPGSMISEQDIADELGLSRTPVHEALQELAQTKIIEILPQRGSRISLIDMNLVEEAVFIRSTLEAAIIELACKSATEEDIQQLEENINLQEFYLAKDNLEKIMELDNAFHKYIYTMTNKMQCYSMIKLMNIHHDRVRELHLHTSNTSTVIEEHKKILEHFKNHDSTGVKELIEMHLKHLYLDEKEIRKKYEEYFCK